MRLPHGYDVVLWFGIAIALVVMFQGPLTDLIEAGSALQDRYGVAAVPGLAVLALAFVGHGVMRRLRDVSETRRLGDVERFVKLAQVLNHAMSMDQLRELLSARLSQLIGWDGVWVVMYVDGEWEALAGGDAKTPCRADPALKARAGQFAALPPEQLDPVRGNQIDGHLCFALSIGDVGTGVMGVPASSAVVSRASRVLAPTSALLGLCARTVELTEELKAHGVVDGLTRCLNRTHGMKVLDAELQRAKRTRTDFALVMLDLDYFKTVNDEHGHLCGDALLTAVGRRMHELLRNSDVKVRFGGEEFLIMLPDTPLPGARHVGRVLNRELGRLAVTWNGHVVSRTVSVGVAAAKPGELDATALLGRVDAALYLAKHAGRDRVCVEGEIVEEPFASEDLGSQHRDPGTASAAVMRG